MNDLRETRDAPVNLRDPVLAAKLLELRTLDGDVPDLDHAYSGAAPAVPVLTFAMNPDVVGLQLARASEDVRLELETTLVQTTSEELVPAAPNVFGYERGVVPAPREGASVSALQVSETERAVATWLALSSRQGRRSLAPPIRSCVADKLAAAGFTVVDGEPTGDVIQHDWCVNLWGQDNLNLRASIPEMAASVLAAKIMRNLVPTTITLDVKPVDGISERRFGWFAVVGRPACSP